MSGWRSGLGANGKVMMDVQQVVALSIVGVAAVYLIRSFVLSARSFFNAKSGCGGGCSRCAFSKEGGAKPLPPTRRTDIIPLMEIRSLPKNDSRSTPHRPGRE